MYKKIAREQRKEAKRQLRKFKQAQLELIIPKGIAKYCKENDEIDVDERILISLKHTVETGSFFEGPEHVAEMVKTLTDLYRETDEKEKHDL